MSKYGFGHRASRHIILDHEGELWLASAPPAIAGLWPRSTVEQPGNLRIEPLEDGKLAKYTYTATESLIEITAVNGAKVKIAIDSGAGAIRITGNTPFRLNAVEVNFLTGSLNMAGGSMISIKMMRYFVVSKKGKLSLDDTYLLNAFRNVTPVLDVEPENGEFEIYVYDAPADTELPEITGTLEACAADNEAEFSSFVDSIVDVPSDWNDVKEKIAYPLWLCHRYLAGDSEVIVENKRESTRTNALLMAIASMAFKDAKKAIDMILAFPAELPPVLGIAAARLLDENMLNDSRGDIFRIYSALETIARWCVKERTVDNDGLSFYAYRYESGADKSPEFFKAGKPVLAPDLNAYLIIVSEIAGKLALMEYDSGIGQKWAAHAKDLKTKLIAELWDGEDFVARNAYTGEASGPDAFLSLVPIILGKRLPDDIIAKLAAKIDFKAADSAVGLLLAGGLYDAGETAAAKSIAETALGNVRANGINCPFYGASLLALAHKVMA